MKKIIYIAVAATTILAVAACSHEKHTPMSEVDRVEAAYDDGRYAKAQALADSLVIGSAFSKLDVYDLCRLSLALMRLGEIAGESEVNTAFAARCLQAAQRRDSDSTAIYIKAMVNEDRARVMMLNSLNEASHEAPLEGDNDEE